MIFLMCFVYPDLGHLRILDAARGSRSLPTPDQDNVAEINMKFVKFKGKHFLS